VRGKRDGLIPASGDIRRHQATCDENDHVIGAKQMGCILGAAVGYVAASVLPVEPEYGEYVAFEVSTAVTMKNVVF
jgi:hypothetical protein